MSKITIKEIAKRAGVSVGTVDRVLHNRGEVADSTRQLVLKIAKEGNYTTNVFARNLKLNKEYVIAVIIPEDNEYWKTQKDGVLRAVSEFESLGMRAEFYTFLREDQDSFVKQSQLVLASNPDGVVIAPLIEDKGKGICEQFRDKDIPFVFVDSDINEIDPLCFVGQDTFQSGYLSAKLLNYGTSGLTTGILIYSDFDSLNKTIRERVDGFRTYYQERGWDSELIQEFIIEDEHFYQKGLIDSSQCLFVPNSRAHQVAFHLGVEKMKSFRVLGYDQIQPNIEMLENDVVDFIINQNPHLQGYLSIQALYKKLIVNAEINPKYYMPVEVVTKENLTYANVSHF